jgi:hypothetical protein
MTILTLAFSFVSRMMCKAISVSSEVQTNVVIRIQACKYERTAHQRPVLAAASCTIQNTNLVCTCGGVAQWSLTELRSNSHYFGSIVSGTGYTSRSSEPLL